MSGGSAQRRPPPAGRTYGFTRRAAGTGLAALDRQQGAAEVYLEVERRLTHYSKYGRGDDLGGYGLGASGNPSASGRQQARMGGTDQKT